MRQNPINPQNQKTEILQESVKVTTSNPQQMSANELSNLDIKTFLNLSEEQQKQYAEIKEQYVVLQSQLASQGEERTQIESQINALEKRQIANILDEEQLIKFNEVWDLKKKIQPELIKDAEQTLTIEQAEQIFAQK